ncbi:DUF3263 domain-containing protein [Arcanobacterium pinnipediorum]|uniref:DUF3263 domain-containing protein n=1 Tax=Arcanobacterium pinnipediorum TaxID=1503041 RepID=A0ABY5AGF1_9ACTO|nr:DUF3263 domain-containing protein [Arcanobacterium pinnipediorum]USR79262.1 DUF3263 domain-containing protein [Arcanobacterium pinnipediorum]
MEQAQQDSSQHLTELEILIFRIEESWWRIAQTKERAIAQELHISPMRYYALLSRMLDDERVWKARPQLVDRLRRLRDGRVEERHPM